MRDAHGSCAGHAGMRGVRTRGSGAHLVAHRGRKVRTWTCGARLGERVAGRAWVHGVVTDGVQDAPGGGRDLVAREWWRGRGRAGEE